MLFSERTNGTKKKSDFSIIKTLIFKAFYDYIIGKKDYLGLHLEYNQNDVTAFFLKRTKVSNLVPSNFDIGVTDNETLFDMIEVACDFLYEEYRKSPHSRIGTGDWEYSDFGKFYQEVNGILFDYGYKINTRKEIEKMPDDGMDGVVSTQIHTDNPDRIDTKIEEAKRQFFSRYATIETRKGACAALAKAVEFIREKSQKTGELSTDIKKLMEIVNTFEIRHNSKGTRLLQSGNKDDENFVDWVFYSLLNCMNYYLKSFHN